jgi:hypothetical protein
MPQAAYLPFAKPVINAETISEVIAVFASGWITSGPKVLEFEAKLSSLFGGRPVRAFSKGPRRCDGRPMTFVSWRTRLRLSTHGGTANVSAASETSSALAFKHAICTHHLFLPRPGHLTGRRVRLTASS